MMKKSFIPILFLLFATSLHGATGTGVSFSGASFNPWAFLSTSPTWSVSGGVAINTPTEGAELLTDGIFATACGAGQWTCGTDFSIGSGILTKAVGSTSGYTSSANATSIGTWYTSSAELALSASYFRVYVGGVFYGNPGTGTKVNTVRATATDSPRIYANSTTGGTVDNFSVKPLTLSTLFATHSSSRSDVLPSVKITKTSGTDGKQAGLITNLDSATSPANFLLWYLDGAGNCKLDKVVAGTYTSVISAACTYVAGTAIVPAKTGTAVSLTYNGVLIGSGTVSDAGIINNTFHGLFSTSSTNSFSDYDSH